MTRSPRLLAAQLALLSLIAAGCGHEALAVPASAIAVVGKRTIPRADYQALIAQARRSYADQGKSFPAVGTAAYRRVKSLAVRLLVERAELEQVAPELGVQIGDDQVAAGLQRLKDDAFGGSEKRYRARLREEQMTDAQVRDGIRAGLLSDALYQAVTAEVTITSGAIQRYYEAHIRSYSTPRSRTILRARTRTLGAAQSAASMLRNGASLAAVEQRFVLAHGSGRVTLVEGRTDPELDATAFPLAVGGVSRPVHTHAGWEVARAVSRVRPGRTTPLAAVRDGIRQKLLGVQRDRVFQHWLAGVRDRFAGQTAFAKGFAPANGG